MCEFGAELAELIKGSAARLVRAIVFVGEIVGGAAEPVDIGKVRAEMAGQHPREDREVLIVGAGESVGGVGMRGVGHGV